MKTARQIVMAVVLVVLIGGVSDLFAGPMQFDRHDNHVVFNHGIKEFPHRPYCGSYISISLPSVRVVAARPVVAVPFVQPVRVVEPVQIVVWIRNDNGSMTSVTLTRNYGGFVGPMGEYYSTMPTEDQLRALYGIRSQYYINQYQ